MLMQVDPVQPGSEVRLGGNGWSYEGVVRTLTDRAGLWQVCIWWAWLFDGGWGSDLLGDVTIVYTHLRWMIRHHFHIIILPRMFIIVPHLRLPGNS